MFPFDSHHYTDIMVLLIINQNIINPLVCSTCEENLHLPRHTGAEASEQHVHAMGHRCLSC